MTNSFLSLLALGALAISLVALAVFCIHSLRRALPQRLARLEEALRIYNSANANLGRQLAELEASLAQLRAPPAAAIAAQPAATPQPHPRPGAAPSAAERYGLRDVPQSAPEFSEAELRLAQLIKSRLATLRLN